jgi:hypothetical protein
MKQMDDFVDYYSLIESIVVIDIVIFAGIYFPKLGRSYCKKFGKTIWTRKWAIGFGCLLLFVFFAIPAQQFYSGDKECNTKWLMRCVI